MNINPIKNSFQRKKWNRNKINYLKYNDNDKEVKKKNEDYDNNKNNTFVLRQILNTGKII